MSQRPLAEVDQVTRSFEGEPQIGDAISPYLTAREAARYLRFSSVRAFYAWRRRHPVVSQQRGRALLFERRALDLAVARSQQGRFRRSA
jgi:hypothetical protein